jgi:hypothetical protein
MFMGTPGSQEAEQSPVQAAGAAPKTPPKQPAVGATEPLLTTGTRVDIDQRGRRVECDALAKVKTGASLPST